MLFPTPEYACFFVLAFIGSWLLARWPAWHRLFLLLASYSFYGLWNWRFVPLLFGVSAFATGIAMLLQRTQSKGLRRALVTLAVLGLLSVLAIFKYLSFALATVAALFATLGARVEISVPELALPVGLSFFAFHGISLVVDSQRKQMSEQVTFVGGLLYVAFFPQLVAGPIARANQLLPQFTKPPHEGLDVAGAALLFARGLMKKALIANALAEHVVNPFYLAPQSAVSADAVLALYGYAVQIYCDFSGYTDMAIASAALLGYQLPQNFAAPYTAHSLRDFWRRWHMTLSRWLREYLYIPLGGSRNGRARTALALFITMTLGGLWHGAGMGFVLWGMSHGAMLVAERAWSTSSTPWVTRLRKSAGWRPLGWFLTFHFVCLTWVLFRSPSIDVAWEALRALVRPGRASLTGVATVLVLASLATQWIPSTWWERVAERWSKLPIAAQGAGVALVVLFVDALGPSGLWPFIYFQF